MQVYLTLFIWKYSLYYSYTSVVTEEVLRYLFENREFVEYSEQ
jgi:hypothetical protein